MRPAGQKEIAVGVEGHVPDVVCFGVEEDRGVAVSVDFEDFGFGGGGGVDVVVRSHGESVDFHGFGLEQGACLALGRDAEDFGFRAGAGVKVAAAVYRHCLKVRGRRFVEFAQLRGEEQFAVAADRDAFGPAFLKVTEGGLVPSLCRFGVA